MSNIHIIEVFQQSDQQWTWHGVAANGEIVDSGESHGSARDAARAAHSVHPGSTMWKLNEHGQRVPLGVHSLDRYSEVKTMLGIPDSEPIFILRAQDALAVGIVGKYAEAAEASEVVSAGFSEHVWECAEEFSKWVTANPNRVKYPD